MKPLYLYKDCYFKVLNPSPATLADRTDKTLTPTNTNMNPSIIELIVAFIAALNNIAEAIRGNAGAPTNIVAGPGSTPATKPAAAAGGGNAAGLEKARAAAAAKREAEKAAKEQAAQDELLLGGGGEAAGAVTLEMLRAKGMEILKAKKQPEMKTLLEGLGAASITALAEDKYQEAYDGLEAILSL